MPNTFTTNFNLTKPEVGGANDTWGELVNTNLTDIDTQLYRKQDKTDQKGTTHTLTFTSGSTNVTTNVTRGFASYAVNDKITISHSGNAANKGEFLIEGITNDITLDLKETDDSEPTFASESVSSTVSIITEINKIEGGLDVSGDTLTTSTAQKDAIVDGSTAITRSGNNLTFAGDVAVTGNMTSGTINEAVLMTGVPRKTRLILVNPTEGQYTHGATNTTETATHDGVAFSAISGKTYLIKVYYVTRAGDSDNNICAWSVKLYRGTSQVSRGATSGFGTQMNYHGFNYRVQGENGENHIRGGHQVILGAFTASSTQTEYIQLVMYNNNQTTVSYMEFQSTNQFCLMEIQEFDSDNFTTET